MDSMHQVVPVIHIGSVYIAELFYGPTFCFKDLGMQGVINLLSYFSSKRKRRTTLLVSTTGDTGPACVHAVKLSNKDQHSYSSDSNDNTTRALCGVNSYNIGRPLMQMIQFFWAYLRVCYQLGITPGETKVDIVIPTGAMGNIAGGYMAKKMGLPLGKLCAGTNINDITYRVIETGKFHRADKMEQTLSEAINIQVPYNFERILYFLTGQNDQLVRRWMTSMDATSKLDLEMIWHDRLQAEFSSARITDDEMCSTMLSVKEKYDFLLDPNTAVAFVATDKLRYHLLIAKDTPSAVAIFATASPCKFQKAVTVALGEEGWKEYESTKFPQRARDFTDSREIPPTKFISLKGQNLEKVQKLWKQKTLCIIDTIHMGTDLENRSTYEPKK